MTQVRNGVEPTQDHVKAPEREMWGDGEGEGKRDALRSNLADTDLYRGLVANGYATALAVRTLDRLLFLSGVDPFLLSKATLAVSEQSDLTRLVWGYSLCDEVDYGNCELIGIISDRALLLRLMVIRLTQRSGSILIQSLMDELVDGLGWGTMTELVPENEPFGGWLPHQLTGEVAE